MVNTYITASHNNNNNTIFLLMRIRIFVSYIGSRYIYLPISDEYY